MEPIKDYLGDENHRNKMHAPLFVELIQRAFGKDIDVLVGHHFSFEVHGDITTENEIPAADTLLFCHDLMTRVFGSAAIPLMQKLAAAPSNRREAIVYEALHVTA